jgi:hypothetical protein
VPALAEQVEARLDLVLGEGVQLQRERRREGGLLEDLDEVVLDRPRGAELHLAARGEEDLLFEGVGAALGGVERVGVAGELADGDERAAAQAGVGVLTEEREDEGEEPGRLELREREDELAAEEAVVLRRALGSASRSSGTRQRSGIWASAPTMAGRSTGGPCR